MKTGWIIFWSLLSVFVLLVISLSIIFSLFQNNDLENSSFAFGKTTVAKIYVNGPIVGDSSSTLFGEQLASSSELRAQIKMAKDDRSVSAIMFEINSPGGSAVASREIADAILNVDKPTASLIREIGASGAYWIASSTDYIVADELSITGSIGVLASSLNFAGFIEDYNISYQQINGGKHKDIGSPFRDMTDEERKLMQAKIDSMHSVFIREVAFNRGISYEEVERAASGIFYLGSEAEKLNLVDELGNEDAVVKYLSVVLAVPKESILFKQYKRKLSFIELISGAFSDFAFKVGEGMSRGLLESGLVVKA